MLCRSFKWNTTFWVPKKYHSHFLIQLRREFLNSLKTNEAKMLHNLEHCRYIACFSAFDRYYHSHCSLKLYNWTPFQSVVFRNIHVAVCSYKYKPQVAGVCIVKFKNPFFNRNVKMWNSLSKNIFSKNQLQRINI